MEKEMLNHPDIDIIDIGDLSSFSHACRRLWIKAR